MIEIGFMKGIIFFVFKAKTTFKIKVDNIFNYNDIVPTVFKRVKYYFNRIFLNNLVLNFKH